MSDQNIELVVRAKAVLEQASKDISTFMQNVEQQSTSATKAAGLSFDELRTGITLAAGAITGLSAGIGVLGSRGADVTDVRNAFAQLNSTIGNDSKAVLDTLRTQFAGTVSDFDLMKMANTALQSGLQASGADFALLANGARVLADRTGGDASQAFQTLATAMATGKTKGAELLIGVVDNAKAIDDYAAKLGKATKDLTEQDKVEALAIATKRQLRETIGGASGATADFGDKVAASKVKVTNLVDSLGTWIAQTPSIGGITSAITGVSGAITIAGATIGPLTSLLGAAGLGGAFTSLTGYLTTTVMPMVSTALPVALKALGALFTMPAGLVVAGVVGALAVWKNWDTIGPIVQGVYTSVKTWLVDKFRPVVDMVRSLVGSVADGFKWLKDVVVDHSYVPDMVNQIGVHMRRLDQQMVEPAGQAIGKVASLFSDLPNVIMAAFTGGGDVGKSIGGSIFGNLFSDTGPMGSLFKKGGDALGNLMGGSMGKALGSTFGSLAGPLGTLLGGMAGDLIGPLMDKVGGFFKGLLGGVSDLEKAGRQTAASFRADVASMATEMDRLEIETLVAQGNNRQWAETAVTVKNAYIATGRSGEEALAAVDRLWKAEKVGGDAVAKVIAEISAVLKTQATPAFEATGVAAVDAFSRTGNVVDYVSTQITALGTTATAVNAELGKPITKVVTTVFQDLWEAGRSTPSNNNDRHSPQAFANYEEWEEDFVARNGEQDRGRARAAYGNVPSMHSGGWLRAHNGMWLGNDEIPLIGQTGERVLSRTEIGRMGGASRVDSLASGGGGTYTIVVPVTLDGREITRVVVPLIPSELRRHGVRL